MTDICVQALEQTLRPLSAAQRAFWAKQFDGSSQSGVIVGLSLDIFAPVQPRLFRMAAQLLNDACDALRTSFARVDGQLRQVVSRDVTVSFEALDLSGAAETDESRNRVVQDWSNQPFELTVAPLIDHLLVKVGPSHWIWHCRTHHLIIDAAGASVGMTALLQAYATLVAGGVPDMSHLGSYAEFLDADEAYLTSERHREDLAYWIGRHAAPPAPLFLAGSGAAHNVAPVRRELSRKQYDALVIACRDEGVQPFHAFIATLGAVAFRLFGRTSLSLGLATHNRSTELDRRTVGLFAGVMAFRFAYHPYESLGDMARRASKQLRRDYRHARLPIDHLAHAVGQPDTPLFDLALSSYPTSVDMDVGGARVRLRSAIFAGKDTEPIAIHIRDPQGDAPLGIDLTYRPDLVSTDDAVTLYDAFIQLLGEWPSARATAIAELG
jgi:hypothetical protein